MLYKCVVNTHRPNLERFPIPREVYYFTKHESTLWRAEKQSGFRQTLISVQPHRHARVGFLVVILKGTSEVNQWQTIQSQPVTKDANISGNPNYSILPSGGLLLQVRAHEYMLSVKIQWGSDSKVRLEFYRAPGTSHSGFVAGNSVPPDNVTPIQPAHHNLGIAREVPLHLQYS